MNESMSSPLRMNSHRIVLQEETWKGIWWLEGETQNDAKLKCHLTIDLRDERDNISDYYKCTLPMLQFKMSGKAFRMSEDGCVGVRGDVLGEMLVFALREGGEDKPIRFKRNLLALQKWDDGSVQPLMAFEINPDTHGILEVVRREGLRQRKGHDNDDIEDSVALVSQLEEKGQRKYKLLVVLSEWKVNISLLVMATACLPKRT